MRPRILSVFLPVFFFGLPQLRAQFTLPNGFTGIVIRDTTSPIVTLHLAVRCGALHFPDVSGSEEHLMEHAFLNAWPGTDAKLRSSARRMAGAVEYTWSDPEAVHFSITLPTDSLAWGLKYITACLRQPSFTPLLTDEAKQNILIENELDVGSTAEFEAEMRKKLWSDAAARKDAWGDYFEARKLSADSLRFMHRNHVHPGACFLAVAGLADSGSVKRQLAELLGDWKTENPVLPEKELNLKKEKSGFFTVYNEFVPRPVLQIAWRGPFYSTDPQAWRGASLLAAALNQPGSVLREKMEGSGLAVSAFAEFEPGYYAGVFKITVFPIADSLQKCIDAARLIVKDLPAFLQKENEEITGNAVMQIATDAALVKEKPSLYAVALARNWQAGFWPDVLHLEHQAAQWTAADINRFTEYFLLTESPQTGLLLRSDHTINDFNPPFAVAAIKSEVVKPPVTIPNADATASIQVLPRTEELRMFYKAGELLPPPELRGDLDAMGRSIALDSGFVWYINTFTDGAGDGYKNYSLTMQRAEAIIDYFVQKFGIDRRRMVARGYGEAFPEFDEKNPKENLKNRRCSISRGDKWKKPEGGSL